MQLLPSRSPSLTPAPLAREGQGLIGMGHAKVRRMKGWASLQVCGYGDSPRTGPAWRNAERIAYKKGVV